MDDRDGIGVVNFTFTFYFKCFPAVELQLHFFWFLFLQLCVHPSIHPGLVRRQHTGAHTHSCKHTMTHVNRDETIGRRHMQADWPFNSAGPAKNKVFFKRVSSHPLVIPTFSCNSTATWWMEGDVQPTASFIYLFNQRKIRFFPHLI